MAQSDMANARRGEITVDIDGRPWTLCLTLGALAEIETHFGVSDLTALGERFSAGRLSARDIAALVTATARGGGMEVTRSDVEKITAGASLLRLYEAVLSLFALSFPLQETTLNPR